MKSIITGRRTPVRAAVLGASLLAAAALPAQTATAHAADEGVELTYKEPTLESGKVTWEWTVSNTDDEGVDKVVLTHKVTFKPKDGPKAKDGDESESLQVSSVDKPCEVQSESVRCEYGMLEAGGEKSGKLVAELRKGASGTAEINGQVSWHQAPMPGEGEPGAQDEEGEPTDQAAPEGAPDPQGIVAP